MANAASPVTECCHSAEIVEDVVDGAVLEECGADNFRYLMSGHSSDPSRLDRMKPTVLASTERFI